MVNGVEIYGGFDPSVGHTEWEDRDWVAHHTILSGDLNGDDEENLANNGENSYHVFYHPEGTNLDATAILDGFTITGGNANGTSLNYGGGMYNDGSSPALTNCTFQSNYGDGGGGMANHGSAPMLTNCAFVDNSGGAGGGMSNLDSSSPTLVNCNFSGDVVSNNGGGIWNDNSSPTLTNCTFSGNSAGSSGGGMHNGGSSPELSNCVFEDNSAEIGGGMYNGGDCSPMLVNCTFAGNSATDGGGMSNEGYASPTLTNCTFYANSASNSGGGMYSYYYSTPALTNSILWEDTPNEVWNENNSTPVVAYSDVQGGYPGDGNIDVYPFFVDAANGDLHLGPCSPCIDAGDDDVTGLPENDFEGDDRIIDGDGNGTATVDMGVDEVAVVGTCSRIYLPLVLRGY
jgi:hypothetical protein